MKSEAWKTKILNKYGEYLAHVSAQRECEAGLRVLLLKVDTVEKKGEKLIAEIENLEAKYLEAREEENEDLIVGEFSTAGDVFSDLGLALLGSEDMCDHLINESPSKPIRDVDCVALAVRSWKAFEGVKQ